MEGKKKIVGRMVARWGSEDEGSAGRERSGGRAAVMGGGQPKGRRRQKTLGRRSMVWKSVKKTTQK